MKYVLVIMDGASDAPVGELDDLTPLQVAETPALDEIATSGRQGTIATIPRASTTSTDRAILSLLGYDPMTFDPGRGPLEAAGLGLELEPKDWVFRCNLVALNDNDDLVDHTAGQITTTETDALIRDLAVALPDHVANDVTGLEFVPGRGHRCLLVDRSARSYDVLETTPPHDLPGRTWQRYGPRGGRPGKFIRSIMDASRSILANHEINLTRTDLGELPASMLWIWGQGRAASLPSFVARTHRNTIVVSASDMVRGLASVASMDRHDVDDVHASCAPGASTHALIEEAAYDIVIIHVGDADVASHRGDFMRKVSEIERIDREIIAPTLATLKTNHADGWRIVATPAHYTLVANQQHDAAAAPFAMAGTGVQSVLARPFTEENSAESDLHIEEGDTFIEFFLESGSDSRR